VIRNPASGGGRARAWDRYQRALRRAGVRLEVVDTTAPGDGAALAAKAVLDGARQVIAAGGDGTAHEVVNGVLRARRDWHGTWISPVVVPLPLGTGNDWARSLALPRDPDALASIVAAAPRHVAWHDVGRVEFDASTHQRPCWFVNVAGAGFDAHVIARMPPPRVPSRLGYLRSALQLWRQYRAPSFDVAADDGAILASGPLLLAFVAIGRYCGHRMHVAPGAQADDGRFDVVTVDSLHLARALPKLWKLYRGTILGDALVRHRLARTVHIAAEPAAPVEADGQLLGTTPVTFTVEPRALRVLRA
jgi:YegS/Rv2252/BmrU family lipid kinase